MYKPTSEDLRLCAAVARTKSLAGAARELALDQSTVFRRLQAVEERLGVRLFERLPEGYLPTSAGLRMADTAERVVCELDYLSRAIAGKDLELSGSVVLTTTHDVAFALLGPILADFHQAHPEVHVDLQLEGRLYDMTRREADIAVRVTASPPEQLVGRQVANGAVAVYVSKALASAGDPTPADLPWIGWQAGTGPTAVWIKENVPPDRIRVTTNTTLSVLALAEAGSGIALLPCYIGDRSTKLVRVARGEVQFSCPLWVLTHRDLRPNARVRALTNALYAGLRRRSPLISGELPTAP